jgi:hypothetical protein
MRLCQDCQQPIPYGRGWGANGVCPPCRGKRSAAVNRAKAAKHGAAYFTPKKFTQEARDARGSSRA